MKFPLVRALVKFRASAALAAAAVWLGTAPRAAVQTHYSSQPYGTSIRVNGSSTTHDWETECVDISAYIEFGAGVKLDKADAAPAGLQDNKAPAKSHIIIKVDN